MNTEAIRAKFEDVETVEVLWGGQIQYDKDDDKYYNVGSAHFDDCDALNQRWAGYQQAVKDMEAEIAELERQLKLAEDAYKSAVYDRR